jgi:hypothetical protein
LAENFVASDAGFRLGKAHAEFDSRTPVLTEFIDVEKTIYNLPVPTQNHFFWDATRKSPISDSIMGNDFKGDCVFAADAKAFKRDERRETQQLFEERLTDQMVVDEYNRKTNNQDVGYSMLRRQRERRAEGWTLALKESGVNDPHAYKTRLFGQIPIDPNSLKTAIYTLNGVQFGILLPLTAYDQLRAGEPWTYVPNSSRNRPGSWGGHAVYCNQWDQYGGSFGVYTWASGDKTDIGAGGKPMRLQTATFDFLARYADECYAHVSELDKAANMGYSIDKIVAALKSEGVNVE